LTSHATEPLNRLLSSMRFVSTEPEDYKAIASALTFTPTGDTVICQNITIVDDSLAEDTQVFLASLDTSDSSVMLLPENATISIEDNDGKMA